jgi:hypothetical protein
MTVSRDINQETLDEGIASIAVACKSDDIAQKFLKEIQLSEECKIRILESLSSDELKLSYLNLIPEKYKERLIAALSSDEKKLEFLESLDKKGKITVMISLKDAKYDDDKLEFINVLEGKEYRDVIQEWMREFWERDVHRFGTFERFKHKPFLERPQVLCDYIQAKLLVSMGDDSKRLSKLKKMRYRDGGFTYTPMVLAESESNSEKLNFIEEVMGEERYFLQLGLLNEDYFDKEKNLFDALIRSLLKTDEPTTNDTAKSWLNKRINSWKERILLEVYSDVLHWTTVIDNYKLKLSQIREQLKKYNPKEKQQTPAEDEVKKLLEDETMYEEEIRFFNQKIKRIQVGFDIESFIERYKSVINDAGNVEKFIELRKVLVDKQKSVEQNRSGSLTSIDEELERQRAILNETKRLFDCCETIFGKNLREEEEEKE